jgi:hypothetical protein
MFPGALTGALAVAKPFIKTWWKPVAIGVAVFAAWWAFDSWRDNLVEAAEKRGFARAEQQYKAAVDKANAVTAGNNKAIDAFASVIGSLTSQRGQDLHLSISPQTQRITDEVASDDRYRDCRVSDSVLDAANTARSAVDASIAASNPK